MPPQPLTLTQHFTKINTYPLPPLAMHAGTFLMSEMQYSTVTGRYRKDGNRFFSSYVDSIKEIASWKTKSVTSA